MLRDMQASPPSRLSVSPYQSRLSESLILLALSESPIVVAYPSRLSESVGMLRDM